MKLEEMKEKKEKQHLETKKSDDDEQGNRRNIPKVSYHKLISLADKLDISLIVVGTISAVFSGLTYPLMILVLEEIIDTLAASSSDPSNIASDVSKVFLKFACFAIGTVIASVFQASCWMVTGERQAARIRSLYLKSILRQDIAFFDRKTTTKDVIGRMSQDTILIQDAIGKKVGNTIQHFSTFYYCFMIAILKGWLLALVLVQCIIFLVVGIKAMSISKLASRGQIASLEEGNILEQTIRAIRTTVASFIGEKAAIEEYSNRSIAITYASAVKQVLAIFFCMGAVCLVLYSISGLAVCFDSKLVVIFAIMACGMSLSNAVSCFHAIVAGRTVAYKMFQAIEKKPLIDSYDTNGVVPQEIKGDIKLNPASQVANDVQAMYKEASEVANDAVSGIQTVVEEWTSEAPVINVMRQGFVHGAVDGFSSFTNYCIYGLTFFIGAQLVQHGIATYAEVFKVLFTLTMAAIGLSKIIALAPDTKKANDFAASNFDILYGKPKMQ